MEIKLYGSSVDIDRGLVWIPALGADAVEVAVVAARDSSLISGVR